MAFIVSIDEEDFIGVTISIPFLHYAMAVFALFRMINTDVKLAGWEIATFVACFIVQYGWGAVYFFIEYDIDDLEIDDKDTSSAGKYVVVYFVLIPFLTSTVSGALKFYDDNFKMSPMFVAMLVLSCIQGLALLAFAYMFLAFWNGIIVTVVLLFVLYLVFQIRIYINNDYYLPKMWQLINVGLLALALIAAFVLSFIIDDFNVFVGFTITILGTAFFILVYSFGVLLQDLNRINSKPIFFSPWIFPVYRYNTRKNDVDKRNEPAVGVIVGMLLVLFWSIFCSVWVSPFYVGISISILVELVLVILALYLISISAIQMKKVQEYIDDRLIRTSWLETKEGYVQGRGASCRERLLSYEKQRYRRDHFRNFIRKREGRDMFKVGFVTQIVDNNQEPDISWIDEDLVTIENNVSCQAYLYRLEQQLKAVYLEELELIIQF